MNRLFEALRDAADGAFVIDDEFRIHYWNAAAEEILGFERGDVAGQFCHRILRGHIEEGGFICNARCALAELALRAEPVPNFDIQARTKANGVRWLNMSVFAYPGAENGEKKLIVHLFHDIDQNKKDEAFFQQVLEIARRNHDLAPEKQTQKSETHLFERLTPREEEVLTLLAQGYSTREIAQSLSISPNTVRNHVQHILQKFQVQSRLAAVTYAIKYGLIEGNL